MAQGRADFRNNGPWGCVTPVWISLVVWGSQREARFRAGWAVLEVQVQALVEFIRAGPPRILCARMKLEIRNRAQP